MDRQEEQMLDILLDYWDWAQNDTRVIGFKPWHLANFAEGANPVSSQTLGAVAMPKVLSLLIHIGRYITGSATTRALKTDDFKLKVQPGGPTRTVMAWVASNSTESAHFILNGEGKGAVNAVSVGGLFGLADNQTDVWLMVDQAAVAAHHRTWQEGDAAAAGIRTLPSLNLIHHGISPGIFGFRVLVQPRVQQRFIAELVSAIEASGVDGLK
jgi:hypothetical protein